MATWKDFVKEAQTPGQMLGQGAIFAPSDHRNEIYNPNSESNLGKRMLYNLTLRNLGRNVTDIPATMVDLVGGVGGAIGGGLGGGEWKNGFISGYKGTDSTFGDWWRYARDFYADKLGISKLMDADYNDADKKMKELYVGPEKDERGNYTERYKQYMKDINAMNAVASGVGTAGATLASWPAFGTVFKGMGDVVGLGMKGVSAGAGAAGNIAMKVPAVARAVDSSRRVMSPVASNARALWNAARATAAPMMSGVIRYLDKAKTAIEPVIRHVRPVANVVEQAATHPATISAMAGATDGLSSYADATERTTSDKRENAIGVVVKEYNDALRNRDARAWELASRRLDILWPEWREANPNAPAPKLPLPSGVPWHDLRKSRGFGDAL